MKAYKLKIKNIRLTIKNIASVANLFLTICNAVCDQNGFFLFLS